MATYHPNDTNCTGWYGEDTGPPPPNTLGLDWVETELTEGLLDDVSGDDNVWHQVASVDNSPGHRIRFAINEDPGDVTEIALTFKGYGRGYGAEGPPGGWKGGWKLWIWNFDSTTYELLDTHVTGSKDTLTGSKTENFSDYIDGSGFVYGLTLADGPEQFGMRDAYLYYAECVITAAPPTTTTEAPTTTTEAPPPTTTTEAPVTTTTEAPAPYAVPLSYILRTAEDG